MTKLIIALCSGVALGVLAVLAITQSGQSSNPVPGDTVRDIVDVPIMTQAIAEKHRDEQYANLVDIQQILSLPTEFARSEAMHILAGRSDSGGVQYLIYEANRIADRIERIGLLNILFFRLAETDPKSALAMARTEQFRTVRSIEQTVWHAWARNDLADALFEAKTQTTTAQRNLAAQSLYAAFGYMGNETTDRIEDELGIGPDRSSRTRYLYQLADRSVAEAIEFINNHERDRKQQEYVSWLAYYVSSDDPATALRYSDLFDVASDRTRYASIINASIARDDPQAVIESVLAGGGDPRSMGAYHNAVRALASTDLDTARWYFGQARSANDKQVLGTAIASEMAKKDPIEALAWSRANDKGLMPSLEMSVLIQIAVTDPQLALTEAMKSSNVQMRSMLLSTVVQQIARGDPAAAVAYLDQIQDQRQQLEVSQQFASVWIQRDAEAAISWILSQDKETAAQLIQQVSLRLLRNDIDTAIRLLPRLDTQNQMNMRLQIAQRLATNRSHDEAQAFIRQFQGQPGYDQLQASVISGLAQSDVLMAKQLADQLADDDARNTAYVQIITQRSQTNPIEAASWLSSISNKNMHDAAAGQIAMQWYARDPAAATRWASHLPAGPTRDNAIMQMSSAWVDPTAEQEDLIASIEDRDRRSQAKMRQIYRIMGTNPTKARELLEDEDISDYLRQQAEMMISRYGSRF